MAWRDPQGAACDIGAFQSRGFSVAGSGGSDQSTPIGALFAQPLTLTLTSAYTEPVAGGHIVFTPPGAGAGLNTADAFTLTLDSGGAVSTTVRANLFVGAYTVTASARWRAGAGDRQPDQHTPCRHGDGGKRRETPRYGEFVTFTATVQGRRKPAMLSPVRRPKPGRPARSRSPSTAAPSGQP